ncbi:MAG: cell division protein ZapA [Pseudomonadota bacterium]|nr:cell division protein ZapA [Pseudomonadales bacterium]MDY6921248.1 cell division protein ZapA [Pseudomonadota bacterium]
MSDDVQTLTVNILDREYGVSCPPDEVEELKSSARLLDQRMRDIRRTGKIVGVDRIAVMAALNIAHDLIRTQAELAGYDRITEKQLTKLNDKIERALAAARQLDL